jgi:hypothetical protein
MRNTHLRDYGYFAWPLLPQIMRSIKFVLTNECANIRAYTVVRCAVFLYFLSRHFSAVFAFALCFCSFESSDALQVSVYHGEWAIKCVYNDTTRPLCLYAPQRPATTALPRAADAATRIMDNLGLDGPLKQLTNAEVGRH